MTFFKELKVRDVVLYEAIVRMEDKLMLKYF